MDDRKFAVFILSHGRPGNVKTAATLEKAGYTGDWFILIDNEDEKAAEYHERYGDRVLVFDKRKAAAEVDSFDNFGKRGSPVYARHANFDIAAGLGYTHFLQLDDDYVAFSYRYDEQLRYLPPMLRVRKTFDALVELMLDFLDDSGSLTVAFAQGGDFIGGSAGTAGATNKPKRKAMNSFFCRVDRRIEWQARLNDDVTTYVVEGSRGKLLLTVMLVGLNQPATQKNPGGLTDAYLEAGTYTKSFYTVIAAPSCTSIVLMGDKHTRLHHRISWSHAVPAILREEHRKS